MAWGVATSQSAVGRTTTWGEQPHAAPPTGAAGIRGRAEPATTTDDAADGVLAFLHFWTIGPDTGKELRCELEW